MNFHAMTKKQAWEYISAQKYDSRAKNILHEKKKRSLAVRFFGQLSDFMTVVLLIAAAVSFFAAFSGGGDFVDPIIIGAIVILNAVLGVIEESRADNAIEALNNISAPHALIKRDGKTQNIASELVRVGDILILEAGCCVSADARLIKSVNTEADESALTGEAMPVLKDADCVLDEFTPVAERKNMVFASTNIVRGRGEAVVTAVGMDTEMGHIAELMTDEGEEPTPLQKKLSQTGKYLGIGALICCAVIFVMGILKQIPVFSMFLTSVSLAVAAIPEGLPTVVTVVLALGVRRMAKHNAIVKHLSAVEALGSATVICADKTGTLTENRMTVDEVFSDDAMHLFETAVLCCDSGTDPTEKAIIDEAVRRGIIQYEQARTCPRIAEIPFDSKRKLMSVLVKYYGSNRIVTKGAANGRKSPACACRCIQRHVRTRDKRKRLNICRAYRYG